MIEHSGEVFKAVKDEMWKTMSLIMCSHVAGKKKVLCFQKVHIPCFGWRVSCSLGCVLLLFCLVSTWRPLPCHLKPAPGLWLRGMGQKVSGLVNISLFLRILFLYSIQQIMLPMFLFERLYCELCFVSASVCMDTVEHKRWIQFEPIISYSILITEL